MNKLFLTSITFLLITSTLFCWQEQLHITPIQNYQRQINIHSRTLTPQIPRYEGFDDMFEGPSGEELIRRELHMLQNTNAILSGLTELGVGLLVGGYVATHIYSLNVNVLSFLGIGFAVTRILNGYKKTTNGFRFLQSDTW